MLPGLEVLIPLILATTLEISPASYNIFFGLPALSSYYLRSEIPLYKAVTISASEIQNLAEGEISTVPSFPIGVCSPPFPLTESPNGLAISLALASVPKKNNN